MQECTIVLFHRKKTKNNHKMQGKHVIENLSLSFVVIAGEHVGTQSKQGTFAREHVDTQDTLALEHVNTQSTLACEHVSTQGTLVRQHVSTQDT